MIKQTILALAVLGMSGCATKPINLASGTINSVSLNADSPLRQNVSVEEIQGGKNKQAFGAMYEFQITNENFEAALKESLSQNNMLASGAGDYLVSAEVIRIRTPALAVNFKVGSDIRYKVVNTSTDEVIMDEIISKEHTTKFGEAWLGEKRMFLATEASVKANITEFITRMNSMFEVDSGGNADGGLIISFNLSLEEKGYLP